MRKTNVITLIPAILIPVLVVLAVMFFPSTLPPKTVKAQTPVSFTFGVAGDYANGSNFQATAGQVKAQNVDFQLAVGDLAYSTVEQSWCNYWKNTVLYNNILIVAGNHDSGESSSGNINTYAQYCPYTLSSPSTGTYAKQYYFDYPQTNPIARFIIISPGLGGSFIGFDANYAVGHQGYTFTQNAIDDARAKGIKWVVVGMHKNCLSMGTKGCEIGIDLMNLLINKQVDLVLQGHDHNYQRGKQLKCAQTNSYNASCVADDGVDNQYTKGAGTIFLINGTGGQGLYSVNPGNPGDCFNTGDSEYCYFAKWMGSNINPTFGFSKFSVTDTQMSAQFIRSAGGTFTDSFTITTDSSLATVDMKANGSDGPITINSGTAATLSWTSTNATSCTASGGWSGSKATSGSQSTGNLITSQTYTLACTGTSGNASDSVAVNILDNQSPSVPTNLTATAASSTQVNLSWTASTDNVGVTVYKIFRNGGITPIGTSSTNFYSDTSVSPATAYIYTVSAYDAAGNESVKSASASVTTPCAAPATDKGVVTTSVHLSTSGTYKILSRIMAPNTTNNSYVLQIDGDCGTIVGDSAITANSWTWVDYKDATLSSKITFNLTVGVHAVKLIGREAGLKMDRVIFTTDLNCVPTGTGDDCTVTSLDSDGDGFSNSVETYLGTDPNRACPATPAANDEPVDTWPPDFDDNQVINIIDLTQLMPPYFGSTAQNPDTNNDGNPEYTPRRDLVPDGVINIIDVNKLLPPVYGSNCNTGALSTVTVEGFNALISGLTETNDTQPPQVTIASPANGSKVSGKVRIHAEASDNIGVTKMEIYIDGSTVFTMDNMTSINYDWNTNSKKVTQGNHTIEVKAYDATNNIGLSSVSVTK